MQEPTVARQSEMCPRLYIDYGQAVRGLVSCVDLQAGETRAITLPISHVTLVRTPESTEI